MPETKAANLRLEEDSWSLLHYFSAAEERPKADIVEDALRDYAAVHQDRLTKHIARVAELAGLPQPKSARARARTASDALEEMRGKRRSRQPVPA